MTCIASIDIGTNTVRLVIFQTKLGELIQLYQAMAITRLGEGMDTKKKLLNARMDETISKLIEFRKKCREFEPLIIRAVATSAVRESSNQQEFVLRAKKEADIGIEVIPWEQEAGLMIKGVLWKLPNTEKSILAFDIGGGSTEFILARDRKIVSAFGTLLGSVRLTEKFISRHPIDVSEYKSLEVFLRRELRKVKDKLSCFSPELLLGTAGTVTTLAAIDGNIYPYESEKIHGKSITFKRVEEILEALKRKSLDERLAMKTIEKGREDLIIAGSALTLEIMRIFNCNLLTISDYGLREGLALDVLNQEC
jgi:exopolyphosphatase / guanosine-5'-triphosphate,3'-diphosphate pyrophosphatase